MNPTATANPFVINDQTQRMIIPIQTSAAGRVIHVQRLFRHAFLMDVGVVVTLSIAF